jgi:hypothetical protein
MQIGPHLGNCRLRVIRSFPPLKTKKPRMSRGSLGLARKMRRLPHFSEATGPLAGAGSGSKPNTPTRYL